MGVAQCYYGGNVMVLRFRVWRGGLVLYTKNYPIQSDAYSRISANSMVVGGIALVLDD